MTKEERRSTIPGLVADTMQDYILTKLFETDIPGKHFDQVREIIDQGVEEGIKAGVVAISRIDEQLGDCLNVQ